MNCERNGGSYVPRNANYMRLGLCYATEYQYTHEKNAPMNLFRPSRNVDGYWWARTGNISYDRLGDPHGRTLAAWFLYWQAREVGA